MARVVEMKAGFVVHKLKIKCAPPRLFYTPLVVTFPVEMLIDPQKLELDHFALPHGRLVLVAVSGVSLVAPVFVVVLESSRLEQLVDASVGLLPLLGYHRMNLFCVLLELRSQVRNEFLLL